MAAGMSTSGSFSLGKNPFLGPTPVTSSFGMLNNVVFKLQQRSCMCFVVEGGKSDPPADNPAKLEVLLLGKETKERLTYVIAGVMSSLGIVSMTVLAVYYKFSYQMEEGGEIPYLEMFGTLALSLGSAVSMELMSRWVHKALWHMHKSHHKPREGAFELNDVFAIMNAVPAIFLLAYGVFYRGLLPGICFGAGLGFTVLDIAYIFVHNGLVHKRFPVGPIANVPYFRKVAAAHQMHHMETFKGVPYGLFLGPKEVEDVGGHEALEMEINKSSNSSASRASVRLDFAQFSKQLSKDFPVKIFWWIFSPILTAMFVSAVKIEFANAFTNAQQVSHKGIHDRPESYQFPNSRARWTDIQLWSPQKNFYRRQLSNYSVPSRSI